MAEIVDLTISEQSSSISGETILKGFDTISIPGDGKVFTIPNGVGKLNDCIINLHATNGSGAVYWSNSDKAIVMAGLGIWNLWGEGVTTNTSKSSILGVVTAYKAVNYQGTIDLEIKVQ